MDRSIDLVLLDVNGVLYDYDPDVRVAALARRLGVEVEAVRDALFTSGLEDRSDAGEVGPDGYLAEAGAALGVELDRNSWAEALRDAVAPKEDVLAVLRSVADQVRLATLSNNELLVRDLFDRIYPAVAELGADAHVAAEYGESKPDRDVYLDACAALGVVPGRTAFVDDKASNAEGASAAGLRAHHFTGVTGLVAFLRAQRLDPAAG